MHKAPTKHALPSDEVVERMRANIAANPDMLRFKCGHTVSVVGYGPSLINTWVDIDTTFPVVTTSGAHDFLTERGIVPDFHVECDSRPHKLAFLRKPNKRTTYLIASVCDPSIFEALRCYNVIMWHPATDAANEQMQLIREVDYGGHLIGGGTNAGQRAILLMFNMGHRKFHCYGMDCSYKDGKTWAGWHSGEPHYMTTVECNGKRFMTSGVMYNSCQEFVEILASPLFHGCEFTVHGDGLLAERLKLAQSGVGAAVTDWIKSA